MLNVNRYISDALAAGGITLPASEEPMREHVSGAYITWEHGNSDTFRASGVPYEQRYRVTLLIWLMPEEMDSRALLVQVQRALALYDAMPGVSCYIGVSRGARDVPELNRKLVQLDVQIVDRMWSR